MASINVLIILFLCFGTMVMMVGVKCQNLWFDEEPKNVERVGKKLIISGNRHPSINYGKHHHYHRNDVDEMDENNVHPHLHHHHHQHSKNIDQHGRWNTEIYEETIPSPVPLRADDADDDADDDDVTFEEYNDDDDQNLASKADRLSSSLANWKKWSPGTSTYGLMANRGSCVVGISIDWLIDQLYFLIMIKKVLLYHRWCQQCPHRQQQRLQHQQRA